MLNQNSATLDLMFQALADPTRRVMVERLSRGPASVSELAKPFAMSLPAVVQHLQVLEQSGLVRSQKQGRVRTCTINTEALGEAEQWLNERRILWENRLNRLEALLDGTDTENQ
jgi:DNA-binding transcriptional ArsR family regulator